jgi:pimeloyl-ACP methyl ester carboxylesterase
MWAKVAEQLTLPNPVYAFDTPGFGSSFDPEGLPDMSDYADWISAAIGQIGIGPFHLVGHHTGAAIAAELAARPDCPAVSVSLIGPLCLTPEDRENSAKLYGTPFVPDAEGAYLAKTWKYLVVGGAAVDPMLIHREMIGMLRAWAARPQAYGAVWRQDFNAAFHAITAPVLIMCAEDDVLWPFFLRAQELRPDVRAVVIRGSNFEPDIAPETVIEAITAFVAGQQA